MTSSIDINQFLIGTFKAVDKTVDKLSERLSSAKKINGPEDNPVEWHRIQRQQADYARLSIVNEQLTQVATSVKVADTSMDTIGKTMDIAKATLESIVKNDPPLPPGSKERETLLKSFSGLRQQIDQLSQPPDEGARKILGDPAEVGQGDWTFEIGQNGMVKVVRKEEVHTGPTGLNIPDLPLNATDAQINAVIGNLDSGKRILTDKRTNLATDSLAVTRAQDFNAKIATLNLKWADDARLADMNETSVQLQIAQVQRDLTVQSMNISANVESSILKFLG